MSNPNLTPPKNATLIHRNGTRQYGIYIMTERTGLGPEHRTEHHEVTPRMYAEIVGGRNVRTLAVVAMPGKNYVFLDGRFYRDAETVHGAINIFHSFASALHADAARDYPDNTNNN